LGSGLAALFAGAIVHTQKSGKIVNYEWVGYLSICVLLLSLAFGRVIFRNMDETTGTPTPPMEIEEDISGEPITTV
jgi:hypothetical protein